MKHKTPAVILLGVVFCLTWGFVHVSIASDCVDYRVYPHWVGSADTPYEANDVTVVDGVAYVADGTSLQLIDITNPKDPVVVGSVDMPGFSGAAAEGVAVAGNYAYVADAWGGLQVVSIMDREHPTIIASLDVDSVSVANHIRLDGNYAYLATQEGLVVIDVTNPAEPAAVATVETPWDAEDVVVAGSYAYVLDWVNLWVIDIANPENPVVAGGLPIATSAGFLYELCVAGAYAYIGTEKEGVLVVDVGNPENPAMVGSVDTPPYSRGVTAMGNYVYVANAEDGLILIDIANPENPVVVNSVNVVYGGWGVAVSGDYAYVAGLWSGLQVVYVGDPGSPETFAVDTPGFAYDVSLANGYAYVADGESGLQVIDITDPRSPRSVGGVETTGYASSAVVSGDYAYVAYGESGLQVVDITNPEAPFIAGVASEPGWMVIDVAIAGGYAFLADYSEGFHVVDIGTPEAPLIVGNVNARGNSVAVHGDYAYVADYLFGLHVINIADPESPQLISDLETPGMAYDVAVVGSYALVADGWMNLEIVDITDPYNPAIVDNVYRSWEEEKEASGVTVVGAYAYITDTKVGLQVIDVANPLAAKIVGTVNTPGEAWAVAVDGGFAYIADGRAGITIAPAQCAITAARLDIKPGSCPNSLNVTVPKGSKANGGVLPVALLGSDQFDVRDIDVSSLELAGASPLRHSFKDVAAPPSQNEACACSEMGPDGYTDLELTFRRLDVVAGLGSVSGSDVPVALTGQMKDGTQFSGTDCVRIVPQKGDLGPQLATTSTPAVTALGPATPNPFNPTTTIAYELAESEHVTLKVFDVTGALVATLVDAEMPGGRHEVTWEAKGVSSGVYFYRMQTGDFAQTRKMVLLK